MNPIGLDVSQPIQDAFQDGGASTNLDDSSSSRQLRRVSRTTQHRSLQLEFQSSQSSLIGVDANPEILAVARRKNGASSDATAILWLESSADSFPVHDAVFIVVCCQLGLMLFPDREAALRDMRGVLIPNGRLTLITPVLAGVLQRNVSAALAPYASSGGLACPARGRASGRTSLAPVGASRRSLARPP